MRALAVLLLGVALGAASRAAGAGCGDLTGDGTLAAGDVVLLMEAVAGLTPGTALCDGSGPVQCGDVFQDGVLTVSDVILLQRRVAGLSVNFFCTGGGPAIPPGSFIEGAITQNQTWPAGTPSCCSCDASNTIYLDGAVFVQSGVTITVKPGTCIAARHQASNFTPSGLVFMRGAKIDAAGRADCPIVFTSDQPPGSRSFQSLGLILNGNAPVNCPGGECLAEGLTNVVFGGDDPNDSSGVLRFVRVEFGGVEIAPDNVADVVMLNGVGRGTVLDHVQANVGFDDCFEWFGGTVDGRYLVASGCGDDLFDWQLGTSGGFQYGLGVQFAGFMQSGNGSNGFEGDNNENGFDFLPRSSPTFCNFTVVGTRGQAPGPFGEQGGSGLLLRRGTAGAVANTIATSFHVGGIAFRDAATAAQACVDHTHLADALAVENVLLHDDGPAGDTQLTSQFSSGPPVCTAEEWYDMSVAARGLLPPRGAGNIGPDPHIDAAYPTSVTSQYVPAGVTCPGPDPLCRAADCRLLHDTLDTTGYVGAFEPGGGDAANWLAPVPGSCWVSFAVN
jgi:hypothetical protein